VNFKKLFFANFSTEFHPRSHIHSALGSVACLDLSPDQSRLCAGYSMGALLVFGLQQPQQQKGGGSGGAVNPAKILFKSTDVVQPGRGILHVKYISKWVNKILIAQMGEK
jgi:hypothetical protein